MPKESKDPLHDLLESVTDELSFLRFVEALRSNRQAAEKLPMTMDGFHGDWANNSIGEFLEAANRWALDSQFGTQHGPKPPNPWKQFALFLFAGQCYE